MMPWTEVPDCEGKRFSGPSIGPNPVIVTTALVSEEEQWEPHHYSESGDPEDMLVIARAASRRHDVLYDALTCINLFGPSGARSVSAFYAFPDDVPVFRVPMRFTPCEPTTFRRRWQDACTSDAVQLMRCFSRLSEDDKAYYARVCYRLSSAVRQSGLTDKAIDLGVALESTFLRDLGSVKGELRYRVSLRAARFLRQGLEERKEVFRAIRDVYDLRSTAVHE